jgi:hypothetical protein
MKSKTSRLAKKMSAATPEQRKAMTFAAVNLPFNWTNDDWGLTFLPRVRVATISLQRDDKALEKFMADIVKDGMAPELLDGWIRTRDHLKGLAEVCNVALQRSFIVLERLGYDPKTELPETKMH